MLRTGALILVTLFLSPLPMAQSGTTVLHNAVIYTVDEAAPRAEAMAFARGQILAVGREEEVLARFPDAERLDAGGRTVVPGLIDAHAHLFGLAASLLQADLVTTGSVDEVVARLQAFEADLPEGAWLLGRGWDQNWWPEARFPSAHDLDGAFPDRPVYLTRVDGHAAWVNSATMRAVGGLDHRQDPSGGRIVRDDDGAPTGVLIDAAMGLVRNAIPEPSRAEVRLSLDLALRETARHGLTGVHDAGLQLSQITVAREAIDEHRFPLRLYAMIGGAGPALEYYCEHGPVIDQGGRLTVRSVKFYIDGALGSRGAALLEEYEDDPGNDGLLMVEPDAFGVMVDRAMGCGLQVNTHAIGDRGARVVLDAYERVIPGHPENPGRHRMEHAQVLAPRDFPRFAELDVIASVQPIHGTSDMGWAEQRLGPERVQGAYAWRTLVDHGARLALGSDFPVEPVSPLIGFHAAITRQDAEGNPPGGWHPDQRLTRDEALRGFTLDAAYAAFMENQVGSLAPGKRADFVILDRDIMTIPAAEILETRVLATFLDGEVVYGGE